MTKQSAGHPHGPMRRKEREITERAEIDAILASEKVMHLALSDDNVPFLVPVFYAYDGTVLYFHSAPAGSKIDILKRNDRVCFEVSVDHGVIEDERACDFEARHRTVIGTGRAVFVEDEAEKIRALDQIVALFTKTHFTYPAPKLAHTTVIRIDIDQIKGKSHGFPKT
ncbi:pyridoxamine 5'-phosphate oxidase family protein [Magnetospirillum fulvum]|jgi:nitroimidazol reductase NimA-like FMN-containing flavoprotein (pyridoxamine 5'-phosphate oxidase superfamily)|uniref:Flavin-nucleotide-binding protein n=1 Tax=Magnetospirillum fulvum TaxID=1082 RepID=A0A1H6H5Z1_MAGFU|nr:pyridoxamine 5'-phosphate oxidase family protein [Magnetospirillum fulvum]SEH31159.1 hypothetical protein SAMN04244559_01083 [Magnetospirillum fulvum]